MANNIFLFFIAVAAVFAGIWLGYSTQDDKQLAGSNTPPIQGAILPSARPLRDINLYTANGLAFSKKDFEQHWSLVFVGYTHCPDVCPNTLSVLSQVSSLMEEQQLNPPRIIFISIDPQRDKPELIDQYVKYFNQAFIGVTGNEKELASISQQLSVVYAKAPGADGLITEDNYLMDHSSSLILINPKAQVQSFLTAPHTPMQIIDSIIRTQVYYTEINK
ncbi:MAG: SCO family protein [Gammaproteobacteria bacterium]